MRNARKQHVFDKEYRKPNLDAKVTLRQKICFIGKCLKTQANLKNSVASLQ